MALAAFRLTIWFVLGLMLAAAAWAPPATAQVPGDTLRLVDAIRLVLDANPTVQIAERELDVALNDATVGNAGYLPSLSFSTGYNGTLSNTNQTFTGGQTQDVTGALTQRQNVGTTLSWTVLDGLNRRGATLDRLREERRAQGFATQAVLEGVLADVVTGYFDVARQQRQRAVLREAVGVSEERLRIARLRRDLGTASDLEVRQARLDLNADRAARLRQDVTLAEARTALGRLLGRVRATDDLVVSERIDLDRTLDAGALREAANRRNPRLRAARRRQRAADLAREEIERERFPSLDATLGSSFSRVDAEAGFLEQSRSLDVQYGLSLTYDAFDGFDRRRRIQNAAARARIAAFEVEDARARIAADLARAAVAYERLLDVVALEAENVALAEENVALGLERFRLGTISSVELREIQEQQIQAGSRLLAAEFEAKRAETQLLRLSGQLLERLAPGRVLRGP